MSDIPGWTIAGLERGLRRARKAIRRVLPFRTRRRPNGAAPLERAELTSIVAERLSGLERNQFSVTSSLLHSTARTSTSLHRVFRLSSVATGAPPIAAFVEKRSSRRAEYRFYKLISKWSVPPGDSIRPSVTIAPMLYAAQDEGAAAPDGRRFVVMIEKISKRGFPQFSTRAAGLLADCIYEVSTISLASYRNPPRRRNEFTPELLERFIEFAASTGQMEDAATRRGIGAMRREWDTLCGAALASLPSIPCHNDLHVDNVLFTRQGEREAWVFIDWEQFGLNHVGADLHHFIRSGLEDTGFGPFSCALLDRYSERMADGHAVDRQTVSVGAHAYALHRCVERTLRRRDVLQIRLAVRLFERMQLLLGLPSGAGAR
jgi:hypothetical protein